MLTEIFKYISTYRYRVQQKSNNQYYKRILNRPMKEIGVRNNGNLGNF